MTSTARCIEIWRWASRRRLCTACALAQAVKRRPAASDLAALRASSQVLKADWPRRCRSAHSAHSAGDGMRSAARPSISNHSSAASPTRLCGHAARGQVQRHGRQQQRGRAQRTTRTASPARWRQMPAHGQQQAGIRRCPWRRSRQRRHPGASRVRQSAATRATPTHRQTIGQIAARQPPAHRRAPGWQARRRPAAVRRRPRGARTRRWPTTQARHQRPRRRAQRKRLPGRRCARRAAGRTQAPQAATRRRVI